MLRRTGLAVLDVVADARRLGLAAVLGRVRREHLQDVFWVAVPVAPLLAEADGSLDEEPGGGAAAHVQELRDIARSDPLTGPDPLLEFGSLLLCRHVTFSLPGDVIVPTDPSVRDDRSAHGGSSVSDLSVSDGSVVFTVPSVSCWMCK